MRKLSVILITFISLTIVILYETTNGDYPPLQDGDLIFQTSTSNQSTSILIATANLYTHMGIIKNDDKNIKVIEAAGAVKETPLEDWVNRGVLRRTAIYRDINLTKEQSKYIVSFAKNLYGKPYDIFFSFNNDSIYCSELPYLAYKEAGIFIGKIQKISDLNFDNYLIKKLIKQRWQRHSECKSNSYDFEQCYKYILNQDLVTPASIANDNKFKKIYSNYPINL